MTRDAAQFPVVQTLAIIAMISFPVQDVLGIAFIFIQPERNPLSEPNSDYALGRLGWLWQLGAIAVGVGPLAMAAGLRMSLAPGKKVRLFLALITVAGASVIGTGVFISGDPLHLVFGLLALSTIIISTFVARGVFARDPRWQPVARLTRWFAWWNVIAILSIFAAPAEFTGLVQRVVFLPGLVWSYVIALRMYRLGPLPAGPPAIAQASVD